MLSIVLASARPEALRAFVEALSSDPGVRLSHVATGARALDAVRTSAPHLVVIDSELPDTAPLDLVQELLRVNAMVNTALISPLADEVFHEATEGLGILGRLPLAPERGDAAALLQNLRKVLGGPG